MIDSEVYSRLHATVGPSVGYRINPASSTQDTQLPHLVYTLTGADSLWTFAGPTGTRTASVTIDVYAVTFGTALDLAAAVRSALDGWHTTTIKIAYLTGATAVPEMDSTQQGYHYSLTFAVIGS